MALTKGRITVLLSAVLILLSSCKPGAEEAVEDSSVKTLDNFARKGGAAIRMNHCGLTDGEAPEEALPLVIKEENIIWPNKQANGWTDAHLKNLKNEVNKVLAQIPPSVMTLFFALDGKIDFSRLPSHPEPLSKVCSNSFEKDKTQFAEGNLLLSCWKRDQKTGSATIFIDPSSDGRSSYKGVHHALIRSFGYILSQMFFYLDIVKGTPADGQQAKEGEIFFDVIEKSEPSENSKALLNNLANAMWKDVYGKSLAEGSRGDEIRFSNNRNYDLSAYKNLYYSNDMNDKLKFQTFVFAEAFDSFHCSTKTRDLMKRDFKNTYCHMKYLDQNLRQKLAFTGSENSELSKLIASYNRIYGVPANECEWETASFQLGGTIPAPTTKGGTATKGSSKGATVTQAPAQIPTYTKGGYTKGGTYGRTTAVARPTCTLGCAIGGFFGAIFKGIGAVVQGVVTVVGAILQVVLYPFQLLFGGVHMNYVPHPGGGAANGGGIYGRPVGQVGKGGSGYPVPCYPQNGGMSGSVINGGIQNQGGLGTNQNVNQNVVAYKLGGGGYQPGTVAPGTTNGVNQSGLRNCLPTPDPSQSPIQQSSYSSEEYDWGTSDYSTPAAKSKTVKRKKSSCGAIAGSNGGMSGIWMLLLLLAPLGVLTFSSLWQRVSTED